MKKHFTFLVAMLAMVGTAAWGQEVDSSAPVQDSFAEKEIVDYTPAISLDARFGYGHQVSGKDAGFGGDGLFLNIDGSISKNFSYSFCHRLFASNGEDSSVFDATDWLTLSYEVGDFCFTAGKDALWIGSYEYDAYDLDCYFDMNSMFYNSISCWQWGITAEWYTSESSSLAIQVANSPFAWEPFKDNLYAYSLGWSDSYEHYESIWSFNLFEWERGKFVKALSLGNMFYFGDFSLNIDCIMRGTKFSNIGEEDLTLMAAPAYEFGDKVRLFGKFGFEKLSSQVPYDFMGEYLLPEEIAAANEENEATLPAYLMPDKDYFFYGAGVEYFPLKNRKDIRLHAFWASNNYTERHSLNVGLTWKFDVVGTISRLLKK